MWLKEHRQPLELFFSRWSQPELDALVMTVLSCLSSFPFLVYGTRGSEKCFDCVQLKTFKLEEQKKTSVTGCCVVFGQCHGVIIGDAEFSHDLVPIPTATLPCCSFKGDTTRSNILLLSEKPLGDT